MKIVICGSIDFTEKIKEVSDKLTECGHDVIIPLTSQRILNGELTLKDFIHEKNTGKSREGIVRKIQDDVIKQYYLKIQKSDAILVLNLEKNHIKNYIGGNTFLEMGFAHVLHKTIYVYNDIPTLSYSDEIHAMQPLIIHGDTHRIQ